MFSGCVWKRQWGGKVCLHLCLYLISCCTQKAVYKTTMKVTSDGQTAAPNYITWGGCLCFCETKHILVNDMARCLYLRCLCREACRSSISLNFSPSRTIAHPWYLPSFSSLPPPASALSFSARHSSVISYTVCTFDQLSWIMVFRFFKVAWISARAENGKQTQVHHPLFLLSSNVSWLFRFCHAFPRETHIPQWLHRQSVSLFFCFLLSTFM